MGLQLAECEINCRLGSRRINSSGSQRKTDARPLQDRCKTRGQELEIFAEVQNEIENRARLVYCVNRPIERSLVDCGGRFSREKPPV